MELFTGVFNVNLNLLRNVIFISFVRLFSNSRAVAHAFLVPLLLLGSVLMPTFFVIICK
jgi:hypothetical protein